MELTSNTLGYREYLTRIINERKRKNPSYSIAAFARSVGFSAPSLSQILSGKRPLSRKATHRFIERLGLSEEEAKVFVQMATLAPPVPSKPTSQLAFEELSYERFQLISNWYTYAILSLAEIAGNRWSARWISKRLGIELAQAKEAMQVLHKLKLIIRKGDGFKQAQGPLWVSTKKDATAIRRFHSQLLKRAKRSLIHETAPLERFTSIVLAADERNLERARKKLRKLAEQAAVTLENGQPNRVYALTIQLTPLSEGKR